MGAATAEMRELRQRGYWVGSAWRDVPGVHRGGAQAPGVILLPRQSLQANEGISVAGFKTCYRAHKHFFRSGPGLPLNMGLCELTLHSKSAEWATSVEIRKK